MFKYVGFLLASLFLIGTLRADTSTVVDTTTETLSDTTTTVESTELPTTIEPTETTIETSTLTLPTTIETTTVVPITTQETTEIPVTTTPHETTKSEPVTSSSTVAPTALPAPEAGYWEITDEAVNITCIRAKMAVQFKVFYDDKEDEHNLSPNATSNKSTCTPAENKTQVLILEDHGYVLTFIFAKDSSSVYVRNMSLVIPSVQHEFENSEKHFEVKADKSYLCNSKSIIKMENVTLEFLDVHLQAFMHKEKDFSLAEDCADDDKMNDIVPISVAIALCLMVVIILVGYLVTRRQSRQRGYQSV